MKTLQDYESWIKTIATFDTMITGYPYNYGAIKDSDTKRLNMLLSDNESVPDYIVRLWRNITNKVQKVEINMEEMNCHDKYAWESAYGYLSWRDIFFDSNGSIKLSLLSKTCRNINNIIIYNIQNAQQGYTPSINLNDSLISELVSFLNYMNDNYLKEQFESLVIINPKIDDLNSFINDNNDNLINKFGWNLNIAPYHDPKRNAKSDKSLFISPIN